MKLWSQMAIQSCPKWRQVRWPWNTFVTGCWFTAGWSCNFGLDRSLWPKQFPLIVEVIIHQQPKFVAGRVGVSSLKRGLGRTLQYPLQEMYMLKSDKSFKKKWSKKKSLVTETVNLWWNGFHFIYIHCLNARQTHNIFLRRNYSIFTQHRKVPSIQVATYHNFYQNARN